MSDLSQKQVNERIRRAVAGITPARAEELWNAPVTRVDRDAWFLEGTYSPDDNVKPDITKQKTNRYKVWAGLAAACLLCLFIGWFQIGRVTDATVYLDVNPSVSLEINRFGRVVAAKAENEDGRDVLRGADLRNRDINTVVNMLVGSMVDRGYLTRTQNALLLSVHGKSRARTEKLSRTLSKDTEETLKTLLGNGIVLGQIVEQDDSAKKIAELYGITPGKGALIIRLLRDHPSWKAGGLAAMSMSDLIRYCQAEGADIEQYLGKDGEIYGDLSDMTEVIPESNEASQSGTEAENTDEKESAARTGTNRQDDDDDEDDDDDDDDESVESEKEDSDDDPEDRNSASDEQEQEDDEEDETADPAESRRHHGGEEEEADHGQYESDDRSSSGNRDDDHNEDSGGRDDDTDDHDNAEDDSDSDDDD